ncbi:hypothetical protein, partial [Novosphingobium umbonatum]|uniref:hypothetical protein n=1 Tax=Novosphingobium umbonatum TaxID=1908524 RepID=UPI001C7088E8
HPKIQKGINPKLDLDRHGQHITHTHPGQFSMKIPGQFSAQLNNRGHGNLQAFKIAKIGKLCQLSAPCPTE